MSMIPKRLLATAALGAALAITGIGETRAMQIPVTTANAIASPATTEQVQWRGYGWRGCGRRGYGWRGGGGWGGGAVAAGLIAGGLIGAAAAAPYYGSSYGYPGYYGYGYPAYYGYQYAYRPRYYGDRRAFHRPYWGYRRA